MRTIFSKYPPIFHRNIKRPTLWELKPRLEHREYHIQIITSRTLPQCYKERILNPTILPSSVNIASHGHSLIPVAQRKECYSIISTQMLGLCKIMRYDRHIVSEMNTSKTSKVSPVHLRLWNRPVGGNLSVRQ